MKRLVMIAGSPSHAPGAHEYRAGWLLLQRCLADVPDLEVEVHAGGWVTDDRALEEADAVAIYSDGGAGHPILVGDRLSRLAASVDGGLGLALLHWAVELPADHGASEVDHWVGGHYEDAVSCNPMWDARFDVLPDHPITRGVTAFSLHDEWYINIRSGQEALTNTATAAADERVDPILVATPSVEVRRGPYVWPHGPYPHIVAQSGRPETLLWATERTDGGRGFGLTGGHYHANWGHDGFRRTVLNALVWLAGAEVPEGGIESRVSAADLERDLDAKG